MREALAAAQAIENEFWRVDALTGLAPHLPEPLKETALREALAAAQAIEDESWRADALTGLAPHLPESLLHEALAAARTIENAEYRVKMLAELTPRLTEISFPALLPLWQELLEIWNPRPRQDLLSNLETLTPVIAKLGG